MSAHFKAEMGMFSLESTLDDRGITVLRGPMSKAVTWQQVTSAALVARAYEYDESEIPGIVSAHASAINAPRCAPFHY